VPLSRLLPAWLANNGLTDGWAELRDAVRATWILGPDRLPPEEIAQLQNVERAIDHLLDHR
jgi:hypothetical protein